MNESLRSLTGFVQNLRRAAGALIALVGLIGLPAVLSVASAAPAAASADTLAAGQTLNPGQALWSADGRYEAVMQTDGNFVEYATNALPGFATGTSSAVPVSLIVQEDSVVIRDSLSGYDIWRKPDSAPPPPAGPGTLLVDMTLATPGVDEGHIGYAIDVSGSGFFSGSIQQVDVYDATVAEIRFVKPGKSAPDDCGNDTDVIKRGNGGSLSRSDLDTLGNTDPKRLYLAACATRTGEWLDKSTGKPLPIHLLLHHS